MGMSAWGFFIAPALIAADPALDDAQKQDAVMASAQSMPADSLDLFSELGVSALDEATMSTASGGASVAVDIANLGVNYAENNGSVSDVNTTNSTNGDISGNYVTDNGGITTVFNNTGNGVVMNSIVNLNIFLQGPSQ